MLVILSHDQSKTEQIIIIIFFLVSNMKMLLQKNTPVTWPFCCHNTLTATAYQLINTTLYLYKHHLLPTSWYCWHLLAGLPTKNRTNYLFRFDAKYWILFVDWFIPPACLGVDHWIYATFNLCSICETSYMKSWM